MKYLSSTFKWLKSKRSRVIILIIIVAAVGFFFWRKNQKPATPQFQTAEVTKGNIVSTVSASGSIITANTLPITTSATGVVKKVHVKDGQEVTKGQKIAEIELDANGAQKNASAYSSYQSAVNSLASAKNSLRSSEASLANTYDQIKGHANDETLAQKETRTKAEVAHDNAYLSLLNSQTNLNSAWYAYQVSSPVVTAPNSGIIQNITVVEGMTLSGSSSSSTDQTTASGQRIAVITTKGTPLASFNISEVDVSKIYQGQKATVTLDSISDKTFTGKVVSVDKMGSSSNGVTNYPVIIRFDTEAPEILPNMAATANIILATKNDVLIVPSSAITTSNGTSTVRVVRNGNEEVTTVETGLTSDSGVEIVSGLTEGEVVVTGTVAGGTSTTGQQGRSVFSPAGGGLGGGGQVRVFSR